MIAPTRKRRAGDARQMIAPVTAPATRDPNDHATKIRPAYGHARLFRKRNDVELHAAKHHAEGT